MTIGLQPGEKMWGGGAGRMGANSGMAFGATVGAWFVWITRSSKNDSLFHVEKKTGI